MAVEGAMRHDARMSRAIGWAGWLIAGIAAVALLVRESSGPDEPVDAHRPVGLPGMRFADAGADAPGRLDERLALLRACELRATRLAASCKPHPPERTESAARAAVDEKYDPGALAEQPAGGPKAGSGSELAAAVAVASEGEQVISGLLGVPLPEARWLAQYVCVVRDLRQATGRELADAVQARRADVEPIIDEALAQREAVLSDLRERLGGERYDKLRSIGGLGLLGSMLDCEPADSTRAPQ